MPTIESTVTLDAQGLTSLAGAIVQAPKAAQDVANASGNRSTGDVFGGMAEGAIKGAATGAAISTAIGAGITGAAVFAGTGGDLALAVAAGSAAAGAAAGAWFAGVGAVVGAVIGLLCALVGAQGSDAGFKDPNQENRVRDAVVAYFTQNPVGPVLALALKSDKHFRSGITVAFSGLFDWSVFEQWLAAFLQGKTSTNYFAREFFRNERRQAVTDKAIELFASFLGRVREAEVAFTAAFGGYGNSIDPSDRSRSGVWQAAAEKAADAFLKLPHGAAYTSDVKARLEQDRAEGQAQMTDAERQQAQKQTDLAKGYTHEFVYHYGPGQNSAPVVMTYRQAQIAVRAIWATPVGAEDGIAATLRPIAGAKMFDANTGKYVPSKNPPPMLQGGSGLAVHAGQLAAAQQAIAADVAAHPNDQNTPLPELSPSAMHPLPGLSHTSLVNLGSASLASTSSSSGGGIFSAIGRFFRWLWNTVTGGDSVSGVDVVGRALNNPMLTAFRAPIVWRGQPIVIDEAAWRAAIGNHAVDRGVMGVGATAIEAANHLRALAPESKAQVYALADHGDARAVEIVDALAQGRLVELKIAAEQLASAACAGNPDAKARAMRVLECAYEDPTGPCGPIARMVGDAIMMQYAAKRAGATSGVFGGSHDLALVAANNDALAA